MSQLIRDPARVISHLKELDDGTLLCDVPCRITVPERWIYRNLATVGTETFITGIFPLIIKADDGNEYYGVSNVMARMQILPSSTVKIKIDGDDYLEFSFDPGDVLVKNINLVVDKTLPYYVYNEVIDKGNLPYLLTYFDLANIFLTSPVYAGLNLGSRSVINLVTSTIARDQKEPMRLYRHVLFKPTDPVKNPPLYIPFRSVVWNTSDTVSKINGAYFSDAINSALVNPSDSVELLEEIYRK